MVWMVHAACMADVRKAYKVLVGKFVGKRPLRWLHVGWKIMLIHITTKMWVLT
jgi:hypothetical protein